MAQFSATSLLFIAIATTGMLVVYGQDTNSLRCGGDLQGGDNNGRKEYLWRVEGRSKPVYLFGTIHVPHTAVWDHVPLDVKDAFSSSDELVLELDLTDENTVGSLESCQQLPARGTLREVLPPALYRRLKQHMTSVRRSLPKWISPEQRRKGFTARNMYEVTTGGWERKRPLWILFLVESLTASRVPQRHLPSLDLFLARRSRDLGKPVAAIETAGEQCRALNGLTQRQVLFALNHTLNIQEKMRRDNEAEADSTREFISKYNCLELEASDFERTQRDNGTDEVAMETSIDAYLRAELLERRNRRMAARIERRMTQSPDRGFFFALGVGHLLGESSVVRHLTRAGFRITRVEAGDSEIGGGNPEEENSGVKSGSSRKFNDLWVLRGDSVPDVDIDVDSRRESSRRRHFRSPLRHLFDEARRTNAASRKSRDVWTWAFAFTISWWWLRRAS